MKSQTKIINIKLNNVSDKLETYMRSQQSCINEFKEQNTEGALRVEEIQFINDETQIVVNAKLFLDISKSIGDIKNKFERFRTRY